MRTAYRAARLFDGAEPHSSPSGMAVVVRDGRIDAVRPGSAVATACFVVELGDVTILPGLIDAHVHLTWDGSPDPLERVQREPWPLTVLRAANHAAAHLRAGVTVVRDLGSTRGLAVELARAIDTGIVAGPRVLAEGRAAAAHAHSLESIHTVLDAGVRSVEHGTGLDATTARRMSRDGIFLVPALSAAGVLATHHGSAFRTALRHEVPIVAGSDSGVPGQRHGSLPDEVVAMVREGATPSRALRAATLDAARLLGVSADHGAFEPGRRADLLVVGGDPFTDITALRDVRMVVRGGRIVVDNDSPDIVHPNAGTVREFVRACRTILRALSSAAGHPDFSTDQQRILLEVGGRAVRDLKAGGAVEVRQCSADRRRRTVAVTEAGRRAYEVLNSAQDKAIGELLDRFSAAERTRLVSAMDTVHWSIRTAMRR